MNARELYTLYQSLADSARQPHLVPARFARLYWVCAIEWLLEMAKAPVSEFVRQATSDFRMTIKGVGAVVGLRSLKEPALCVRSLRVDFGLRRVGIPVEPVDSDALGERLQDPFERPTDDDPLYCEEDNGELTIYSDTTPTAFILSVFAYPAPLNFDSSVAVAGGPEVHIQILRRVVAEKDLIDEKYNRYQLLAGQKIPAGEQPL